MTFIIETRNVSYSYGDGIEAMKDVSISLDEGRKSLWWGQMGRQIHTHAHVQRHPEANLWRSSLSWTIFAI